MNKILTISIAAYNVSKYIEEGLSSLLIEKYLDQLEIMVIDDGSTDNTESLVLPYVQKFPQTVLYIKKENGGYGSTINYSIKHASGKYFKLLDGDDFLNEKGFKNLLEILLEKDYDIIVSQALRLFPGGKEKDIYKFIDESLSGKLLNIKEAIPYSDVAVWTYTIKTEIIRKTWIDLPLHSFYTDRIFISRALENAKNIFYSKDPVYVYRVGHNEQSTSKNSIKKHYKEVLNVDSILRDILRETQTLHTYSYISSRIASYFSETILMLMVLKKNKENFSMIYNYDNQIKKEYPEIYSIMSKRNKRVKLLRRTNYLFYYIWPMIEIVRTKFLNKY